MAVALLELVQHRLCVAEHLEHEVGAHEQARRAAGAARMQLGLVVAHAVHAPSDIVSTPGRARGDAQLAALARLDVDGDRAARLDAMVVIDLAQ